VDEVVNEERLSLGGSGINGAGKMSVSEEDAGSPAAGSESDRSLAA